MNSSRTYLPSGLRRVVDNPDTQMLSRGRAPSTLKLSSLNLDLYLWATCRTFALKRPLRLSWPHCPRAHSQKEIPPELPRPVEQTFVAENTSIFREIRVKFISGRSGPGNQRPFGKIPISLVRSAVFLNSHCGRPWVQPGPAVDPSIPILRGPHPHPIGLLARIIHKVFSNGG